MIVVSILKNGDLRFGSKDQLEPVNGEIATYHLPLEEIWAKYGKPNLKKIAKENEIRMTILANAREKISPDELNILLDKGLKPTQVARRFKVPPWTISKLKNEYDNIQQNQGKEDKPLEPNVTELQENQVSSPVIDSATLSQPIDREPSEPDNQINQHDFGEVAWLPPKGHKPGEKFVRITDDKISLSAAVVAAFSLKTIKIGITTAGILIIAPDNDSTNFKITKHGGVGGTGLSRQLREHGYLPGKYRLFQSNDRFISRKGLRIEVTA